MLEDFGMVSRMKGVPIIHSEARSANAEVVLPVVRGMRLKFGFCFADLHWMCILVVVERSKNCDARVISTVTTGRAK